MLTQYPRLRRTSLLLAAAFLAACSGSSEGTGDGSGSDAHEAGVDVVTDATVGDARGNDATADTRGSDVVSTNDVSANDVATRDVPTPPDDVPTPPDDVPAAMDVRDVPAVPDVPTPPDSGDPCGGCPRGFVCTAGVCKTPMGVPAFGQVYVMMMENESRTSIVDNSSAPYINSLFGSSSTFTNYSDVTHPSLPNYLALTSGDYWGVSCDGQPGTSSSGACGSFCIFNTDCDANQDVAHLGDQLDTAGLAWRMYGQSMGSPCNTASSDPYAVKHIPFLYYDNLRTDAARCARHVRDTDDLASDLGNYAFSMISPDLCHDMHDDCAPTNDKVQQGDDWLSENVPVVTGAPGFDQNGVLFIVWDEGDFSLRDNIALIVISPLAKTGFMSARAYDHYSLLATIQDGLGLPRLANSTSAVPVTDIWN